MVETWVANPSTNYGVLMKATNENTDGCDVRLASSENSVTQYRPYLEVCDTCPIAKKYYLKDHLGNICVTIDANGVIKAYDDYYPFGLQMPGRTYNNSLNNPRYKYSSKVAAPRIRGVDPHTPARKNSKFQASNSKQISILNFRT
jgi:hypothetical protein